MINVSNSVVTQTPASAPNQGKQDAGNQCGEDIHCIITNQNKPYEPVRTFEQARGPISSRVCLPQMLQAKTIERHHRCFRAGEKG